MYKNNFPSKEMSYIGSFIYDENLNKAYVLFDEGRLMDDEGDYTYEYFLKDHLGNTRVSFTKDGTLVEKLQEDHYYPFGMTFQGVNSSILSPENKYKYNGKELQDDDVNGNMLDWYDYGARMYDPSIGRWHVVDPLVEWSFKTSPFAYVANNPIRYIDPDGQNRDDRIIRRATKRFKRILKRNPNANVKLDIWRGSNGKLIASVDAGTTSGVASKVYGGSSSSSSSSSWNGGFNFVSKGPVQGKETRENNSAQTIDISSFIPSVGVSPTGIFLSNFRSALSILSKITDLVQNLIETPDKEINAKNKTNNRGDEIDNKGQLKNMHKNWIEEKNGKFSVFKDPTGDSVLFINPYEPPVFYVPWKRAKRGVNGEVMHRERIPYKK